MPITVTLPAEYTQEDLFFAAITAQAENYQAGEEAEGKNANNARLFESPAVHIIDDTGEVEISTASHSGENVKEFNSLTDKAPDTKIWSTIRAQYPFQWNENGEFISENSMLTKAQLAQYLANFVELFKKLWPKIETILKERQANITINSDLIFSLAVFLKMMLKPKNSQTLEKENLLFIDTLLTSINNNISNKVYMIPKPSDSIESCCNSMMRLISLSLTQPVGKETAYGGIFKSREHYMPRHLLETDYGKAPFQEFNFPDRYQIPEACFLISENTSDKQLLWDFFSENTDFIDQVDRARCSSELYQTTLHRLWNAFTNDARCPQWIKNKKQTLKNQITSEDPASLSKLLATVSDRIANVNQETSLSLENTLLSLTKKVLIALVRQTRERHTISTITVDIISTNNIVTDLMKNSLLNLMDRFAKEKTLDAQFCSSIITGAYNFLFSIPYETLSDTNFYAQLEKHIKNVFVITNLRKKYAHFGLTNRDGYFESFSSKTFKHIEARCPSMENKQIEETLRDLFALKDVAPKKLLQPTLLTLWQELNLKYEKELLRALDDANTDKAVVFPVYNYTETQGFKDYLNIIEKDAKNFINTENYIQYRTILQAQRETESTSFQTLFMRWVNFSKNSGAIINAKVLFFNASATQAEVEYCFNTVQQDNSLRSSQKQAFLENLRNCCINNSENGEYIWNEIKKNHPVIITDDTKDLLSLLSLYEKERERDDVSKDHQETESKINAYCPKENLQLLTTTLKASPTTYRQQFFWSVISEEAQKIFDILDQKKSIVNILLELRNQASSGKNPTYTMVNTFLNLNATLPHSNLLKH